MQFVVEWESVNYGLDYLIAFIGGGIILLLFCYERFAQPIQKSEIFVSTLLPAHLATKQAYLKAFLIYLFIMLTIYTILSIVGPSLFQAFNIAQTGNLDTGTAGYISNMSFKDPNVKDAFLDYPKIGAPAWIPLIIMLILSGASTRYKALNKVELIVRGLTHRIIGIPDGIERLANRIRDAKIDLQSLSDADKSFIKQKYHLITGKELSDVKVLYKELESLDVIRRWIRLQFLYDRLENKRQQVADVIDLNVLDYYHNTWNEVKLSVLNRLDQKYLKEFYVDRDGEEDQLDRDTIVIKQEKEIDETLHRMHALLAASMARGSRSVESITTAMSKLGLSVKQVRQNEVINGVILAIFLMALLVFLIVYLTSQLPHWFGVSFASPFPTDPVEALQWATGTLFLHGTAAFSAWHYREARESRRSWEVLYIRKLQIPSKQYLFLLFKVYIVSTISLFIWWILYELLTPGPFPEISKEQLWIPIFGILGSCTGVWVAYTIDLCTRPKVSKSRIAIQVASQAIYTFLICYILMSILNRSHGSESFNIYVSAIAGSVGLTLGLIVLLITHNIYLHKEEI